MKFKIIFGLTMLAVLIGILIFISYSDLPLYDVKEPSLEVATGYTIKIIGGDSFTTLYEIRDEAGHKFILYDGHKKGGIVQVRDNY